MAIFVLYHIRIVGYLRPCLSLSKALLFDLGPVWINILFADYSTRQVLMYKLFLYQKIKQI